MNRWPGARVAPAAARRPWTVRAAHWTAFLDRPARSPYLPLVAPRLLLVVVAAWVVAAPIAVADPGGATPAPADDLAVARRIEAELVRLLEHVDASTVSLLGCKSQAGGTATVLGAGSGVLVSYRGTWLVTNGHVVNGCSRIEAILPGGARERVRVVATDKTADLAILAFDERPASLVPVPIAEGHEPLAEGTWVVATGNPFLLAEDGASAASLGVFSGQRGAACEARLGGCSLQHDAEINPGSSGGPLWSVEGRLLGVNGAIVTRSRLEGTGPAYSGASFSVPTPRVAAFIDQVLGPTSRASVTGPTTTRTAATTRRQGAAARLGARLVAVQDGRGSGLGVRIRDILSSSPLRRGRALVDGDRIIEVRIAGSRRAVRTLADLDQALAQAPAGAEVTLLADRGGVRVAWQGTPDA